MRNRINALAALAPEMLIFPGHDLPEIPKTRDDIVLHAPDLFRLEGWVDE